MKTDTQFILRGSDTLNLKIQNLENCFNTAKRLGYNYVAVKVDMQGFEKPEIIINSSENFEEKLDYYKKAYDENLILRSFNGIFFFPYPLTLVNVPLRIVFHFSLASVSFILLIASLILSSLVA